MQIPFRFAGAAALLLTVMTSSAAAQGYQYCAVEYDPTRPYDNVYQLFLTAVHPSSRPGVDEWLTFASHKHPSQGPGFPMAFQSMPYRNFDGFRYWQEVPVSKADMGPIYPFVAREHGLPIDDDPLDWRYNYSYLCNVFPDRDWATAARDTAVTKLRSAGVSFEQTAWVDLPLDYTPPAEPARTPAPVAAKPAPRRRAAITVATPDDARARELEEIRRKAYEDEKRAIAARERRQAMDRAVQEQMLKRNLEIKRRSAERLAEVMRLRKACLAGDKSACRVDPERSGAREE